MIPRTSSLLLLIATVFILIACSDAVEDEPPDTDEIISMFEERPGYIVDVRTPAEFEEGHLKEVDYHIDFRSDDFKMNLQQLDKNQTYYLYCRTGNRSGQTKEIMEEMGFKSVFNIGGYRDLVDAGLSPVPDPVDQDFDK